MSPERPPTPRPRRPAPARRPAAGATPPTPDETAAPRAPRGRARRGDEPATGSPRATRPTTDGARAVPPTTGGTRAVRPTTGSTRAVRPTTGGTRAVPPTTGSTRTAAPQSGATRTVTSATGPTRTVTTYATGRFSGPVRPAVVSTTSRERFAERARARRNLARRQVLLTAGGVLTAGALAWLLLWSPVLALDPERVEVTGAGTVVAVDQVLAVVRAEGGTPLPRLDTVGLRDAVLEVPGVREARVVREWPDGVAVQLVSREPVAAVPDDASGLVLLDEQGVQVGRADAAPEGLPVVDVPVNDARTLAAVLRVLEQLPPDLLGQVASVEAATQDRVRMQLRDGPLVEWGSADQTALKVAVLGALRQAPASAGASVLDVSAPRMPIAR